MKKAALEVGKTYTDEKGNSRLFLGRGSIFARVSQQDCDCVQFKVTEKKRGPQSLNSVYTSTATAFASWAKSATP